MGALLKAAAGAALVLTAATAIRCGGGPQETSEEAMENAETSHGRIEIIDEAFRQVIAPDAAVRLIAKDLRFTEGPVWLDTEGEFLVFSDIPADTLYRWEPEKSLQVFRKPSHNANGNTTDPKGRLVTAEHGSRSVTRTDRDGNVTTLASTYQGGKFNSPNDVVVRADGTVWFTDPPYGLGDRKREQERNYVFRLEPGASEPVAVANDFERPNGLCFTPDQKHLYIADSDHSRSHVRRFRVTDDLALADGHVFADIAPPAPDGIRADREGRLYVTAGDGVQVFASGGELIGKVHLPVRPTNCCFGDEDRETLYITARTNVYAVRLQAAGLP